ncbi:thiol reductant ABC exporter subunit CydD [Lampropedia puyangensis]|uniref:Thiol reductant ABC exporter subunit CydD n=1 Tax=Lampropedia puyangensis TaxID=1330072 RepID=A0A4S8EXB6_9BURK|nr:thiol reductant ABC exporter subunit CydD [Lampropedia puyangensis]THT99236.1 thiol reductant ABC exporter subunit CydD [Lampropedia puyangensis]
MKSHNPRKPRAGRHWSYALQGIASLVWIGQAWCIASVVSSLMLWQTEGRNALQSQSLMHSVLLAVAMVAILGLIRAALEYWGTKTTYGYARQVLTSLRQALGDRLRMASPLDARRPPSGEITSAWMEQAEAVVPWLARYQAAQWRVMIAAPIIAIVVAWHSWIAALLLLMAAPLIPLFMAIIGWRAQAISEEQMQSLGSMHGHLLERLRGLPTLRAMHAVDATAQRLSAQGRHVAQKTMKVLRVAMLSSAVLELFSALGVALVAVYIGFHLLGELPFGAWGSQLSLHSGLFILMLAPSFFEPLRELSAVWHDRANGQAAMQRLTDMLEDLAPMVHAHATGEYPIAQQELSEAESTPPSVRIVNATPQLESAPNTLSTPAAHALNIQIPAGAHVAITGPSGSGKSMLLAMVAGLVALRSGQVLLDEEAMTPENAAQLRQRMAWMGQTPHFFTGSLQRNLYLGRHRTYLPTDEAQLLGQVGLSDVFSQQHAQRLGEGGSGISGGEALRLALARLAVAERAGLLLLDEPTAHLDSQTAQQIIRTIKDLAKGKTLLVVTHDPALIAALEHTITLDGQGGATWQNHAVEAHA